MIYNTYHVVEKYEKYKVISNNFYISYTFSKINKYKLNYKIYKNNFFKMINS